MIRGNNLSKDLTPFIPEGFAFVTEERTRAKYERCLVRAGDLVFTCWGSIGQVGLIPESGPFDEYVISNKQLKLRVDAETADSRFVYYYVASRAGVEFLESRASGSAVPGINLGILKSITIGLPPLDEQRRIADILSAYDDLIENNNRRMALLEEAIHLLYREWFVSLRFPGHDRFEITDGVPKGWRNLPLEDICTVNRESIKKRSAPPSINYVDIASVTIGRINAILPMNFDNAPSRARRVVRDGDIIWATVRPGNRAYALVLEPVEDLIASTGFAVLTPAEVPSSFLYCATTTDWFVAHMEAIAGGAAYPAVKAADFEEYELLVPPPAILEDFDELARPSLRQMRLLDQQNTRLREARDLLLPRLMDGSLPV